MSEYNIKYTIINTTGVVSLQDIFVKLTSSTSV